MSKAPPGPRELALRAMREANYDADEKRRRAAEALRTGEQRGHAVIEKQRQKAKARKAKQIPKGTTRG